LVAETWEPPGDRHLWELGVEAENCILFVGTLRPDKCVHLLVDAYSRLQTEVPLVIVGDNPDDTSYVQSLRQRSDGRVKYLGYQHGLTTRQLFAYCLMQAQPSVVEGTLLHS
jgi:glycosyltransferase involved in cell wall biosynthesis